MFRQAATDSEKQNLYTVWIKCQGTKHYKELYTCIVTVLLWGAE